MKKNSWSQLTVLSLLSRGDVQGIALLFYLCNRKKQLREYRSNMLIWVLFRETPPASEGPDVVPRSPVCCVSFTIAGFQHVVTLRHSFVVSEAGSALHMLN